jgi:uncharacterized membrane protein
MDTAYLWLKAAHILGGVLFLGNIVVSGWWKAMADRTRDARIVAFAQRQITRTDWVFTFGGVLLVLATGLANAHLHGMTYAAHPWMLWGMALFVASGVIWVALLVPLQTRLARLARGFASENAPIPQDYWRLSRWWNFWGVIATALPLAVVYFMVFKGAA